MTITYIFHSGFALELEEAILVFDFWKDPRHVMPLVLMKQKPIYVFASHFHEDHFNSEIFQWKKQHGDVTYVLSKDIYKHRRADRSEGDVWLAKGGAWSDGRVDVRAMGSTDSGVSWIVEVEGKRIFHAGDLNNWFAARDGDDLGEKNRYEGTKTLGIDPEAHEKRYLGELKDILKVTSSFDVVMFPIDGRIGRSSSARLLPTGRKNGYTLGGRQFIERFKVGLFVPMHFVASGFESSWRMKEFTDEKGIPFWEICREGETITIV